MHSHMVIVHGIFDQEANDTIDDNLQETIETSPKNFTGDVESRSGKTLVASRAVSEGSFDGVRSASYTSCKVLQGVDKAREVHTRGAM